jgi:hypothetical protein
MSRKGIYQTSLLPARNDVRYAGCRYPAAERVACLLIQKSTPHGRGGSTGGTTIVGVDSVQSAASRASTGAPLPDVKSWTGADAARFSPHVVTRMFGSVVGGENAGYEGAERQSVSGMARSERGIRYAGF